MLNIFAVAGGGDAAVELAVLLRVVRPGGPAAAQDLGISDNGAHAPEGCLPENRHASSG
jgi:hypothetical protein